MKRYIYSGLVFIAAFVLGSCADEELKPILTFDDMIKGGYPRLITETNREFDLFNLGTASYSYTVEFVTIDKGENVAEYSVDVRLNNGSLVNLRTLGQGDFTTNANGFREVTVNATLNEMLPLFGITAADLNPLDVVTFDTQVTLTDGISFRSSNSSAAVNGSAFSSHFRFTLSVTCPMPDTQFAGTYSVDYVDVNDAPNCFTGGPTLTASIPDMVLAPVSGSTTKRSVAPAGGGIPWALSGFQYPGNAQVDFVCTQVSLTQNWDLNGSCGGDILLTSGAAQSVNISDDSSFVLEINEFSNGECGCPEITFQLQFTKQ